MGKISQAGIPQFLLELEEAFSRAMVSNDVERISRCITDDWILVTPEAGPVPRSGILGVIASGILTHATMTKVPTHACVIGDVAWITGRGQNTGTFKGSAMQADEYITDIYRRVDGRWRCMLTHLTPAKASHGGYTTVDIEDVICRYIAAYNAFDIDRMMVLVTEDVRFENYSNAQLTAEASGIDAFRALAEQAKQLFSEREQRITSLRIDGSQAFAEISYRGRLAADIPGGPAAGTLLDLQGQSEFQITGGRIAKLVDRS